ncbi:hypothetical protein DID88_004334 [Monilinia fructigena]|uniref:ABC1 atypical kinase-like domain-containing protein n=1 Tax=Monilinia fructigena TaxID=38457 RepID=A0A395ISG4_9HELO|nr:hypothetical protein DID88_004334 [Monilinia fructigena]
MLAAAASSSPAAFVRLSEKDNGGTEMTTEARMLEASREEISRRVGDEVQVIITIPAAYFGPRDKTRDDERIGTSLWWYKFLVKAMERAGPAFIKEKPLGVGAIAQVYKAKLKPDLATPGDPDLREPTNIRQNVRKNVDTLIKSTPQRVPSNYVAIKVLHPGVERVVRRDLRIIRNWEDLNPGIDLLSSALPILRELGAQRSGMLRQGDFSMLKVWAGLEARKFLQASIEDVERCVKYDLLSPNV